MATKPQPGTYREITLSSIILGILIGIMLSACFTYAGLLIGFTIGGSAVAAILGFGVLRGILRKGTIVETNITQTIASAINTTTPGIIFTIPAFYLMGIDFNPYLVGLASIAGAILGVTFIVPIRKQMIDLDRLRFPTGTAVATVLKSPGAGVAKSRILVVGIFISAIVYFLSQFPIQFANGSYLFGITSSAIPATVDIGYWMGLPSYIDNVWAISLFCLGAGFISGRPGLVVLAGGILAYWMIAPFAMKQGWVPENLVQTFQSQSGSEKISAGHEISGWIHEMINRPIGIGMLIGGALIGIILSAPSIKASLSSLKRIDLKGGGSDELPIKVLYVGVTVAFIILFLATYFIAPIGLLRSFLVAIFGTLWLAFSGIVVAQATGMTDWSPISGMALISVIVVLLLSGNSVGAAILIGAAVCVAVSECADMMQDLKTGHLVGAIPFRQQVVELAFTGIGPIISLVVIAMLWNSFGFGPGHDLRAPQGQALQAAIEGIQGGNVPWPKYIGGAIIGAMLGFTGVAGMGVLVGLSMYLPINYILPFGLGCLIQMTLSKTKGEHWTEHKGVPFAAGLLVGEPLVVVVQSFLIISGIILPPGA